MSSYSLTIDTGVSTVNLNALFNVSSGVPAAQAHLLITFFSGSTYSTMTSTLDSSLILDTDNTTWQQVTLTATIPIDTRWVLSQVAYETDTLGAAPGFVDSASLTVILEPGTYALLGLGAIALLVYSRRRQRALV